MGFSPRDDVHWIPTPFRNNQWNLTNRDGPPDLAQLRRHGSGVPKLSLSGLRIASLIMLELLFWTYFKLLLDVATIYNYIHWFCTILHMFAILYLGDSKLDHWLELQQKAERCGAINRPGEHRLQWRTWIASNLGVYRYRFLWIFLTWQPVLVTSKMPLRMPGRTGGHRSALYIGRTPHSRGKEKDAVPMNLDLQPRSVKLGSYRHNFVQLAVVTLIYRVYIIHKWSTDFGLVIIIHISWMNYSMEYAIIIIVLTTGILIMDYVNNNHGFIIIIVYNIHGLLWNIM